MAEDKKRRKVYGIGDMFNVQTCPVCDKDFVVPDSRSWAYKRRGKDGKKMFYFCSYGCKNTYLRQKGIEVL